jgi:hypothetical protein
MRDCMVSFMCTCCDLMQLQRELDARGSLTPAPTSSSVLAQHHPKPRTAPIKSPSKSLAPKAPLKA